MTHARRSQPVAVAALLLAVTQAHAHRMSILILPEGSALHGYAYYADGDPVKGVSVRVLNDQGQPVATLETDGEGRFAYEPADDGRLSFVAETADGHRAEARYERTAREAVADDDSERPTSALGAPASSEIRRVVQEEIAPLRVQLDAYERSTRFRDILGGIGYIVGVTGLLAWWKARRGTGPA